MADATLLPCPVPWCAQQDAPQTYQGCTDQWVVICPSCGVNGPVAMTEELAKEAWFYLPRQPPSQVPAEDVERVAQAIALVYNADAGSTAHDVVEIDRKAARAALTALQVTEGDKS
jgi:hypothetical protein